VPSVERVTALVGRVPTTVLADRRFGTAANDRTLAELRVRRIGLQHSGTPGKARQEYERSRPFRRMRNWRVGIEGIARPTERAATSRNRYGRTRRADTAGYRPVRQYPEIHAAAIRAVAPATERTVARSALCRHDPLQGATVSKITIYDASASSKSASPYAVRHA
jgi:hypothetical protein